MSDKVCVGNSKHELRTVIARSAPCDEAIAAYRERDCCALLAMTRHTWKRWVCVVLLVVVGLTLVAACAWQAPLRIATVGEYQISGSAQDSYNNPTVNNPSDTKVRMGQSGVELTAGYRFGAVDIPRGATIVSATLSVNIVFTYGSNWNLLIYGEDSATCADFSVSWPASRTLTIASVAWSPPAGTGWKTSPNISTVIQEIVNRTDWSSGNSLCLIVVDNQSTNNVYQDAFAYDGNPANAARLSINFAAPTPTPTPFCGQIVQDTVWSGSYTLGCPIGVARGVTLTIAPGSTINTNGPYKWDVFGTLYAIGLPTSTITLTSGISTTRGSWGPLFILGAAHMDYVTVSYGTALEVAAAAAITHSLFTSNSIGVDMLASGRLVSSTVQYNDVGVLVRGNVSPTIQAVNILPANDLGLWNAQSVTLTIPGLWWGTTVTATIEGMIRDQMDDYRLGRVEWWPVAGEAW